jgi:type I restriction enzyme S subunit
MELKPGYKQTEVGVIPEDWDVKALSRLHCEAIDCHHSTPIWKESGEIVIRNQNIRDGRLNLADTSYTNEKAYQERIRRAVPSHPDLVITREAPMGEVCMIPAGLKCCLGQRMVLLRIQSDNVDQSYVLYALQAQSSRRFIGAVGGTGSTVSNIRIPILKSLPVAVPAHSEQKKISAALGDINELIIHLERLVLKKHNIKQATMQELLTGKRRLPGFEGEWEVTTVRDVVSRHFCGPSPTCEERNIEGDHEWGVLKTTAITWENGWSWKAHKLLPPSYWGKTDIELKKGDVLVTKAGPRHRVGVSAWVDHVPSRIIPSGKMIALRPIPKKAEPLMLAAAIASRETQIFLDQRTTGMAESQVNFENSVLLAAPISLPSVAEQTAISEICRDFDEELQDLEKKAATLLRLKEGMMQQLLTGKIRLA